MTHVVIGTGIACFAAGLIAAWAWDYFVSNPGDREDPAETAQIAAEKQRQKDDAILRAAVREHNKDRERADQTVADLVDWCRRNGSLPPSVRFNASSSRGLGSVE